MWSLSIRRKMFYYFSAYFGQFSRSFEVKRSREPKISRLAMHSVRSLGRVFPCWKFLKLVGARRRARSFRNNCLKDSRFFPKSASSKSLIALKPISSKLLFAIQFIQVALRILSMSLANF